MITIVLHATLPSRELISVFPYEDPTRGLVDSHGIGVEGANELEAKTMDEGDRESKLHYGIWRECEIGSPCGLNDDMNIRFWSCLNGVI